MSRRIWLGVCLGALLAGAHAAYAAEPAAGGASLLDASESAAATVVGVVRAPARVDAHGYAATLDVERALAGALAPGSSQRIAWEELALARPPRFADGDRVLVALAALPGASLWRQRFPVTKDGPRVLVVAAEGDAFLRRPDARTIDLLARYLALPEAERSQGAGVDAIAALVQGADPAVAAAALRRLEGTPGVDSRLGEAGRSALAATAGDETRPFELRAELVAWVGRARIAPLRPTLEALARPGSPLQAESTEALGVLDGGLPPERGDALLRSPDPKLRAVGVRFASGPKADEKIGDLLRADPAPAVRAAAVRRIVARRSAAAVDDAASALFDADDSVRAAAAEALGSVGEPATPTLLRLALARTGREALGPIAALALVGPSGGKALSEIATTHRDPNTRKAALFALGQAPHEHAVTLDEHPEPEPSR